MILPFLVASSAKQISAMASSVFLVKFTLRLRTSREGLIQFLTSKYYIIEQHDYMYMRYYIEVMCIICTLRLISRCMYAYGYYYFSALKQYDSH